VPIEGRRIKQVRTWFDSSLSLLGRMEPIYGDAGFCGQHGENRDERGSKNPP
jgi:hypothetical protein